MRPDSHRPVHSTSALGSSLGPASIAPCPLPASGSAAPIRETTPGRAARPGTRRSTGESGRDHDRIRCPVLIYLPVGRARRAAARDRATPRETAITHVTGSTRSIGSVRPCRVRRATPMGDWAIGPIRLWALASAHTPTQHTKLGRRAASGAPATRARERGRCEIGDARTVAIRI
jgi:hypothetical protein